ncbi:MFS general substrate transporter [Microthyrium microscopicum]|uniref:MFS general substrate transporter n=1 Tax=Microthyrium microscopicum TaxID=703497 RepID=A0A6A6U1A5_9PEZI|nr:MFS general substrate transporter [Microthyrium microscopicum]
MAEHSETTPLLSTSEQPASQPNHASNPASSSAVHTLKSTAQGLRTHLKTYSTLYLIILFVLAIDFPSFMSQTASLRVYELAICRDYYREHDPSVIDPHGFIDEHLCKLKGIQSGVSNMKALKAFLDEFIGALMVIPYGIAADTYGRKMVVVLSVIGLLMASSWEILVLRCFDIFPTNAFYFASGFLVIGGGNSVVVPVLLTMLADTSPPEYRTEVFFYFTSSFLVTEILAPPIGKHLMDAIGPYNTVIIIIPACLSSLSFVFVIPETLQKSEQVEEPGTASLSSDSSLLSKIQAKVIGIKMHLKEGALPLLKRPVLILVLLAMSLNKLSRPILMVTLQYVSAVFGWTLGETSYLLSLQATVQLGLCTIVLPIIHRYLNHRVKDTRKANLIFAKGCTIFLVAGALTMGFSRVISVFITGMVIFLLGYGYGAALRSWATELVPKNEVALLYTVMALFDGVGALAGAPLLYGSLSYGLGHGGSLIGLPYFVAAILFGLSALLTWNLSEGEKIEEEETEG